MPFIIIRKEMAIVQILNMIQQAMKSPGGGQQQAQPTAGGEAQQQAQPAAGGAQ